jgi:hypothetical protein
VAALAGAQPKAVIMRAKPSFPVSYPTMIHPRHRSMLVILPFPLDFCSRAGGDDLLVGAPDAEQGHGNPAFRQSIVRSSYFGINSAFDTASMSLRFSVHK